MTEVFPEDCFLCGSSVQYREITNAGTRCYYRCTNEHCGEYEISAFAIKKIEEVPDFKRQASEKVQNFWEIQHYPIITYNAEKDTLEYIFGNKPT